MNPAQTCLYWRSWGLACRAQKWTSLEAIAAAREVRRAGVIWVSPDLNAILNGVWKLAVLLAEHRDPEGRVTLTDLRHSCHVLATGKNVGSKRFCNGALDACLALFRLLSEPDNLANVVTWENRFELGERKRLVHSICDAPAPYWQAIARDKFGHTSLDRLTLDELRQLSLTLRERSRTKAAQAARERGPVATEAPTA